VAADLRGALTTPKTVHHAAITDPSEVGVLLKTMEDYTNDDEAEFELDRIAICGRLDGRWFMSVMLVDGDGNAHGMLGCRAFRSGARAREAMANAH
jgi:hypothetical protein